MNKEEMGICNRLWEGMQKNSSPWVWSRREKAFVAQINGLTLTLYGLSFPEHKSFHLRIQDGYTQKTLSPRNWDEPLLWRMLDFLKKREHAECHERQNALMAKLSALLSR